MKHSEWHLAGDNLLRDRHVRVLETIEEHVDSHAVRQALRVVEDMAFLSSY